MRKECEEWMKEQEVSVQTWKERGGREEGSESEKRRRERERGGREEGREKGRN